MDELIIVAYLKKVALFASILSILVGLDLLSGAKIISNLKKILDMSFNLDKIIVRASSLFRKTLDTYVNFDDN